MRPALCEARDTVVSTAVRSMQTKKGGLISNYDSQRGGWAGRSDNKAEIYGLNRSPWGEEG